MKKYTIITDAASDLSAEMARELQVSVTPMGVTLGNTSFEDYYDGKEMDYTEFYQRIRAGEKVITSAVSPGKWIDVIGSELAAGNDVLVIAFSSALSSTCDNANIAAAELGEKFPQRRIEVVNSLCASLGQSFFIRMAAWKRDEGLDLTQLKEYLEENKLKVCHWFTVDDLGHLRRGGRISTTTAVLGSALGIKPILHVDNEGRLINVGKTRGRKNALNALLDHMEETVIDPASQSVILGHADCLGEVQVLAEEIKRRFHVREVIIESVGAIIGAHSGPGTVALFFYGKER